MVSPPQLPRKTQYHPKTMRAFIFIPPLRHLSGGLAVLYQVAEQMHDLGYPVWVVPRAEGAPGLENCRAPVMGFDDLHLTADDLWLVPEGWSNALAPGLRAKACCLVYVQNWAFLFSSLPEGVAWRDLKARFLAVSRPVAWFVSSSLGQEAPILRPALDVNLFGPVPAARPPAARGVRIAWMPRKNKALALQVQQIIAARGAMPAPVTWVEIQHKTPAQVAEALRSCHLFMATGFPEGLALPPLEAMACGCLVAGFAGLGAWDYMRQALPGGYLPLCPLPPLPWQDTPAAANAFVAADGDALGLALALEAAANVIVNQPKAYAALQQYGQATAAGYSAEQQRQAIAALWRDLSAAPRGA